MGSYNNRYIKSEDGLFRSDKYHQTKLGSALAATAIYAGIYKKMPSISAKSFQHSSNDVTLTNTQIDRFKTVVKAKYSW